MRAGRGTAETDASTVRHSALRSSLGLLLGSQQGSARKIDPWTGTGPATAEDYGPAKVACVTSGLFGTVSGSAVANVMTTGTFTIPLMRHVGYRATFAGAVEAVASSGGQLMPPVMGVAAFLMAEFMGRSYFDVVSRGYAPALIYYASVSVSVYLLSTRYRASLAFVAAHGADGVEFVHVLGSRHQQWHRTERFAAKVGIQSGNENTDTA